MKWKIVCMVVILCCILSACNDEENNIFNQEANSPDKEYIATVYDYSLSAVAPGGQKVYISNADGTKKTEVFFAYGYECQVEWVNETKLKITVCKIYNQSVYSIKRMKEKWGKVEIVYDKIVSDNFESDEPWEPED